MRSLAQLTTPFSASGNAPKWVFFPKDRTYRAFFVLLHKRNFFRMVPEGLNAFWTFVMQLRPAVSFFSLWEGQKWGFFPKDRTYRAFFVLLQKRNFFRMVAKGMIAFWSFVHAAESASYLFLLFGANSSPEKVQHVLVSPNSIKKVPNGMFLCAATGSGVLLCWGRCTKISTFSRDTPHHSQN